MFDEADPFSKRFFWLVRDGMVMGGLVVWCWYVWCWGGSWRGWVRSWRGVGWVGGVVLGR